MNRDETEGESVEKPGESQVSGDQPSGGEITRCDYCRLPCPDETVRLERDPRTYEFCSKACRAAVERQRKVFTEYHGHRRLTTGVSALDASLPQGYRATRSSC